MTINIIRRTEPLSPRCPAERERLMREAAPYGTRKEIERAFSRRETVIAAAVRNPADGAYYYAMRPARHGHVIAALVQKLPELRGVVPGDWEQGFVTSSLRFLGRKEAFDLVKTNGQLRPITRIVDGVRRTHTPTGPTLYTEDLW